MVKKVHSYLLLESVQLRVSYHIQILVGLTRQTLADTERAATVASAKEIIFLFFIRFFLSFFLQDHAILWTCGFVYQIYRLTIDYHIGIIPQFYKVTFCHLVIKKQILGFQQKPSKFASIYKDTVTENLQQTFWKNFLEDLYWCLKIGAIRPKCSSTYAGTFVQIAPVNGKPLHCFSIQMSENTWVQFQQPFHQEQLPLLRHKHDMYITFEEKARKKGESEVK